MRDAVSILMRHGLVAGVLLLVLIIGRGALACSCGVPLPAQLLLERTPVIFTGVAVQEAVDPSGASAAMTFTVVNPVKGEVGERPVVGTLLADSMCGFRFRLHEPATVLAFPTSEGGAAPLRFVTNSCTISNYLRHRPAFDALVTELRQEAAQIQAARAEAPGDIPLLLARARHFEQLHDARAEAAFAELANARPSLVAGHLGLARLALRRGAISEARIHVGRVLAQDGENSEAAKLLDAARLLDGDMTVLGVRRDWRWLEVPNLDLSGRDFRRGDFRDTRVASFRARNADLREASFEGAVFESADLTTADLRGVALAHLTVGSLDLSGARLDGANLSGVSFAAGRLSGAKLRHARGEGVDFRRADLRRALFREARLPGAQFQNANLADADLSGAMLVGANLAWANLAGADLTGANLRGASFELALYDCRTRLPGAVSPRILGMVHATPRNASCGSQRRQ